MIGEMKREALHSLKGKWGLGVGSTILYHIVIAQCQYGTKSLQVMLGWPEICMITHCC